MNKFDFLDGATRMEDEAPEAFRRGDSYWFVNDSTLDDYAKKVVFKGYPGGLRQILDTHTGGRQGDTNVGLDLAGGTHGVALVLHRPYGALQHQDPSVYLGAVHLLLDMVRPNGVLFAQVPGCLTYDRKAWGPVWRSLCRRDDMAELAIGMQRGIGPSTSFLMGVKAAKLAQ